MGINKMEYNKCHLHGLTECYGCSKDGGTSVFAEVKTCAIEKAVNLENKQIYD